jgi:hypothetical protein
MATTAGRITNENFRELEDLQGKRKFMLRYISKNPLTNTN